MKTALNAVLQEESIHENTVAVLADAINQEFKAQGMDTVALENVRNVLESTDAEKIHAVLPSAVDESDLQDLSSVDPSNPEVELAQPTVEETTTAGPDDVAATPDSNKRQ